MRKISGSAPSVLDEIVSAGATGLTGLPSYAGLRLGRYEADQCIYVPLAARLGKSRAAIARGAVGNLFARVLCLGESTTAGRGAVRNVSSYPAILASQLLQSGVQPAGTGYVPAGMTDLDPRWTFTGSFAGTPNTLTTADGYAAAYSGATSGSTATFTADQPGTVVSFDYDDVGGNFTYSIDGGTATAVAIAFSGTVKTITVTGLPAANHTLKITSTSTSSCAILGAEVRTTYGVSVTNLGQAGAESIWWTGTSYSNALNTAKRLAPTLTIINLAINDQNDAISTANHKANLATVITAMQGVGSEVILVNPHQTNLGDNAAYIAALYDLADQYGCLLVDQRDRFGTYAQMNAAGVHFDGFHLLPAGYMMASSTILPLVQPQGTTPVLKTYTDLVKASLPAVGESVFSDGIVSAAAASPTSGRWTAHPMWVAPGTYDAIIISVSTALVAGSATIVSKAAIYTDDLTVGQRYLPNTLPSGTIASGSVSLTTVGLQAVVLGTPWVCPGGFFWGGFFYSASTTPTTASSLSCINNCTYSIGNASTLSFNNRVRGWSRTGLSDLPVVATTNTNATRSAANDIVIVGLRRSA